MTDNEMRIVIAEKCGFCGGNIIRDQDDSWCDKCDKKGCHPSHTFPDYPNDLNAMHEAEKQLDDLIVDKRSLYFDWLCLNAEGFPDRFEGHWAVCRATALQRAEAFIKTVCPEKWKGDK